MRRHLPILAIAAGGLLFCLLAVGYLTLTSRSSGLRSDQVDPTASAGTETVAPERSARPVPESEPRALMPSQGLPATPPPADVEDGSDAIIRRLRTSGPDQRGLLDSARQITAPWITAARQKSLDVAFGEWECFRAGCLIEARHGSEALVDRMTEEMTHSTSFHQWNGEKVRTGPVTTNGKTVVTWAFFSPPAQEGALQAAADFEVWKNADRPVR